MTQSTDRKSSTLPSFPGTSFIGQEEEQAVLEVLRSGELFRYHGNKEHPSKCDLLEQHFAKHTGASHVLAVTSGTAALICALQSIGVGPGDEVIVPAYTWLATAAAVLAVNGIPIVAEVDESLTLDPADVEAKITPYTKAIIVVHMRGAPSQMDELLAIAKRRGLKLIEDTAQANGGSYRGRRLGALGDAGCFSLQLSKIITAGEGGILITSDDNVWKRALMFHDVPGGERQGITKDEILWGINFRMPELLAAVALAQLGKLESILTNLRARKQMLKGGMEEVAQRKGITFRAIPDAEGDTGATLIFFAPDAAQADQIARKLQEANIGAGLMYHPDRSDYHVYAHWLPVMEQRTWTEAGGPWRWAQRDIQYHKEMCPRSLELLGRAINMNIDPLMSNDEMEELIEGVNQVLDQI